RARQGQAARGWSCPREEAVAAYLDRALEAGQRAKFERHLADCLYCRTLVADVVKLQRVNELAGAPAVLLERVRSRAGTPTTRFPWNWLPLATAGTLACTVLGALLLRTPELPPTPSWPAPPGPVIAKSLPPLPAAAPHGDPIRKASAADCRPAITSPFPQSVVSQGRLEFRWNEVPAALYYHGRLLTPEGDVVWEGDSAKPQLGLPRGLLLAAGRYFVMVS